MVRAHMEAETRGQGQITESDHARIFSYSGLDRKGLVGEDFEIVKRHLSGNPRLCLNSWKVERSVWFSLRFKILG